MAQIVDVHGRPLKRETLKTEQTVKVRESLRVFPDHPSRGINIRKLPRILQAAEQGDIQAQAMLFADMEERDGHLFAEMEKRKSALLTLDWSIEPPPGATAEEKNLTAAVSDWLQGIPNMEDVLLNGMTAVGYGFSCQEIAWHLTDKVWLPESISLKPHHWFTTLPEHGDEIRLDDGTYQDGKKALSCGRSVGWFIGRMPAQVLSDRRGCSACWPGRICSKTLRCATLLNFWKFTAFRPVSLTTHRARATPTATAFWRRWSRLVMKPWPQSRRGTKSSSKVQLLAVAIRLWR